MGKKKSSGIKYKNEEEAYNDLMRLIKVWKKNGTTYYHRSSYLKSLKVQFRSERICEIIFSNDRIFDLNKERFDYAIYNFLIDNLFEEFVRNYKILKNMYKDKDADVTLFIELLRKYLSEYVGYKISKLGDAKECVDKVKALDPCYIRDIKLK